MDIPPDGQDVTFRVILDSALCVIAILPSVILMAGVYPFKRGFFCDDESIAHPFKESTISTAVMVVVSLGLPLICMLSVEIYLYRQQLKLGKSSSSKVYYFCKRSIHPFFVTFYLIIGPFLFGAAVCQVSTDIFKYSLGRLRPHFLTVCKPDFDNFDCYVDNRMKYVEDDVCTGDEALIKEARLSHVSGHASFSVYCMLYLAFYLQSRMRWKGSSLLRPFLQVLFLYLALGCCVSRISDYKHHWSDVLGGALLGVAVSIIVVLFVSKLFARPKVPEINHEASELRSPPNERSYQQGSGTGYGGTDSSIKIEH